MLPDTLLICLSRLAHSQVNAMIVLFETITRIMNKETRDYGRALWSALSQPLLQSVDYEFFLCLSNLDTCLITLRNRTQLLQFRIFSPVKMTCIVFKILS